MRENKRSSHWCLHRSTVGLLWIAPEIRNWRIVLFIAEELVPAGNIGRLLFDLYGPLVMESLVPFNIYALRPTE